MSPGKPSNTASGPPNLPPSQLDIDPNSQNTLSQAEFLGPLEDPQEIHVMEFDDNSPFSKPSQRPQSPQITDVKYVIRPQIDTAEDIAAAFKYQKPPTPQTLFNNPKHLQAVPGSHPTSSIHGVPQISYQHDPAFKPPTGVVSRPNKTKLASQEPSHDDGTVAASGTQKDEKAAPVVVVHDDTSGHTSNEGKTQKVDPEPGSVSDQRVPHHASKDNAEIPHQKERQRQSYDSPLSKIRTSKAISDVCNRALAQGSARHHSTPRKGTSGSSVNGASSLLRHVATHQVNPRESRTSSHGHRYRDKNGFSNHGSFDGSGKRTSRKNSQAAQRGRHTNTITRPFPEESPYQDLQMMRPCSQASNISNISKPRAPRKTKRGQSSPTLEQSDALRGKLADAWNSALAYDSQLKQSYTKKISMLQETIAAQNEVIQHCNQEIAARDDEIATLAEEKEEIVDQFQLQQDKHAKSSKKVEELKEKLSECQDLLDKAIREQQTIFDYCRAKCQKTIAKIKAEEQSHKESMQRALAATDSVRSKIQQDIDAVVRASGKEARELGITIESLKVQLAEHQKEAELEKEHSKDLHEQLTEFRKLNGEALQSLISQNKELLGKAEHERVEAENTQTCIRKQDEKIEAILNALHESRSNELDITALAADLKTIQNDGVSTIVDEIKNTLAAREALSEDQENIRANVEATRVLCEGLCERMTDHQTAEEWQQRYYDVDMTSRFQEQRVQELENSLDQAHIQAGAQWQTEQQLREQLAGLKDVANANDASKQKAEALAEQVAQLKQTLTEKNATITQLDGSFRVVREELKAQTQRLQERDDQIQTERKNHETYKQETDMNTQMREQIISKAISERTSIEGEYQELQKCFQETEIARTQLQQELDQAKQSADISQRSKLEEKLEQVCEKLAATMDQVTNISEGLQANEDIRKVLKPELEKWSNDGLAVAQMKQVVKRLERDQPNAIEMTNQLKELVDIQKKLSSTKEYHEKQLVDIRAATGLYDVVDTGSMELNSIKEASSLLSNPPSTIVGPSSEQSQYLRRRVVVRSPNGDVGAVPPVSIEQERVTRRQAATPRGIIKMVTRSQSRESETVENKDAVTAQTLVNASTKSRVASRGSNVPLLTHSTYNRPVAGSVTKTPDSDEENKEQIDSEQKYSGTKRPMSIQVQSTAEDKKSMPQSRPEESIERPIKRHRYLEPSQDQGSQLAPKQRPRISHSMSQYFPGPFQDDGVRHEMPRLQPKLLLQRGGPLERKPTTLVTYGSQNKVATPNYSQASSRSDSLASNASPWTTGSKDGIDLSQTMKEESQRL
ncbi:hypothetical protein F5X99DRAFT_431466 [Biscogniauxia marginata]|nr:hypothetical protein F5X99DRAFT_431466 [Biscogniauxia marginata]